MADMWTPEPNIEQSRRSAQNFWTTPQGGYGSGWGAALAALGAGAGYGLFSSDANNAETSNQKFRADTMTRAAQAPDGTSMAKILMGSGIPGMDTQGLSTITAERNRAASQAFQQQQAAENRAHQEKMARLQFQNQQALREEPEIVRTLKAAGYVPGTPAFQEALKSTIKGQDPMAQAKIGVLRELGLLPGEQPAAPAPVPAQPRLIPQSNEGPDADPNLIPIQAGGPAPAPQTPPQGPAIMQGLTPQQRAGVGLSILGMGDAGKIIADAGNVNKLGKDAANENDKAELQAVEGLSRLRNIRASFDPDFLNWGTRAQMAVLSLQAKTGKLDTNQTEKLYKFATFKRDAANNFNAAIKAASGATVTAQEFERNGVELPNAGSGIFDGDDPVSFKAKIDRGEEVMALGVARHRMLRERGFTGDVMKMAEMVPLDMMRQIINKRAAQLEQSIRQQNPQMPKQILDREVDLRIKKEFGI